MANVCLAVFNQLNSKVVQLIEVVAGIGNFPGFESEPSDTLKNCFVVDGIFCFRVGVIEAEICFALVIRSVTKIDCNRFGMTAAWS